MASKTLRTWTLLFSTHRCGDSRAFTESRAPHLHAALSSPLGSHKLPRQVWSPAGSAGPGASERRDVHFTLSSTSAGHGTVGKGGGSHCHPHTPSPPTAASIDQEPGSRVAAPSRARLSDESRVQLTLDVHLPPTALAPSWGLKLGLASSRIPLCQVRGHHECLQPLDSSPMSLWSRVLHFVRL